MTNRTTKLSTTTRTSCEAVNACCINISFERSSCGSGSSGGANLTPFGRDSRPQEQVAGSRAESDTDATCFEVYGG
jgi:hypothetical protein